MDLKVDSDDNLINLNGKYLGDFIKNRDFSNIVNKITRHATYKNKETGLIRQSMSLIDVVITNCVLKSWCETSNCSISDHKAILIALDMKSNAKIKPLVIKCRQFNKVNMDDIVQKLLFEKFADINKINDINDKLAYFNRRIMQIVDNVAPTKNKKIKPADDGSLPWVDIELIKLTGQKNNANAFVTPLYKTKARIWI
jgi:hypothetical protein